MKCPKCWTDKAYRRRIKGLKGHLLRLILIVPLRCHHCYHKFHVPWFFTIGKETTPAPIAAASRTLRPSRAASPPVTIPIDSANRRLETSPRRRKAA